jgi:hypothetical protein
VAEDDQISDEDNWQSTRLATPFSGPNDGVHLRQ